MSFRTLSALYRVSIKEVSEGGGGGWGESNLLSLLQISHKMSPNQGAPKVR